MTYIITMFLSTCKSIVIDNDNNHNSSEKFNIEVLFSLFQSSRSLDVIFLKYDISKGQMFKNQWLVRYRRPTVGRNNTH